MEGRIISIIRDCVEPGPAARPIDADTSVKSLMIDSLKMIQIVFEIEICFGIEIPEHALFQVDTVNDLVDLVRVSKAA
ncbi:acyl carrier protein [Pseudohongiella sp.]|uniref:Carrier domain-containing protein n=1 Tax=marine sediment metagenome TaxID=412755 RepID=A0A0F9Z4F4_9ZZZZ|nr:acyl carrier protein [Pseudohongiella sp.]